MESRFGVWGLGFGFSLRCGAMVCDEETIFISRWGGLGLEVWGLEFRVQGLGVSGEGLGVEIWGLGFGVWGLGLGFGFEVWV